MPKHDQNYQVGDHVTWTSQAQGSTKSKTGIVVAVIPPNGHVMDIYNALSAEEKGLRTNFVYGGGFPRNSISYLIAVPSVSGRGKTKIYWPLTSALRLTKKATIVPQDEKASLAIRTRARDAQYALAETYPEIASLSPAAANALRDALVRMVAE